MAIYIRKGRPSSGHKLLASFNGVGGMSAVLTRPVVVGSPSFMVRNDRPYGTLIGVSTNGPLSPVPPGKSYGSASLVQRIRAGFSCTIPSSPAIVPSTAKLFFGINFFTSPNEAWTSQLYLSNTDDSAFGAGWYNNLDNNCGTSLGSTDSPGSCVFNVPTSLMIPGNKISFILGTDRELAGTGGATGGLGSADGFTCGGFLTQLVLTY